GKVTTTSLAHVVIALRQTLLSLNGAITQYGAADPDPAADLKGILNTAPIQPPGGGAPVVFSARVRTVFSECAKFVRDVLTSAEGQVYNSASSNASGGGSFTASTEAATLDSQAAA